MGRVLLDLSKMASSKKFYGGNGLFNGKRGQLGNAGLIKNRSLPVLDLTSKKTLGTVFAILALALWILDVTDFLGSVYSGFNFNPQDFWDNWLKKFTFGNIAFDAGLVIITIFLVFKYIREKQRPNSADVIAVSIFTTTMIFLITNIGWMAYPKAIIHFVFILLFGLLYVGRTSGLNSGFLIVSGLLLFDFFFFSTMLKFMPFLKYLSLLGAIVIIWTFAESPSYTTGILFILLIMFILVLTIADGLPANGIFFQESEVQKASLSQLINKFQLGIAQYRKQIEISFQRQIQYAITGKVEQNQYEPLGVYLERVQAAQKSFYTDEDVVVWGNVKARTLADPINIQLGCFVKSGSARKPATKIDPEKKFSVHTLEEQDFACSFKSGSLEAGSNTVTTFAEFNFETLAFKKMYFMDRDRLRAMTREGQDPFAVFSIKDKNPIPVYTNGPAKIEMGASSSLIGVSDSYIAFPRISLGISNREGWEGRIGALKEVVLLLPKGAVITEPEKDCNLKFKKYDGETCQKQSCEQFVYQECIDVCKGYAGSKERSSCDAACSDKRAQCQNECQFLFEEDGQQYNGFQLDIDSIKPKIKKQEDWENYQFFTCRINPIPSEILGNAPITTKSFRAKIRYNYTVEKPVGVTIVKIGDNTDKIGGPAITRSSSMERKVLEIANQRKFNNPQLTIAVASVESSFRHCRDGETSCGTSSPSNVLNNGEGWGMMQINKRAHPGAFVIESAELKAAGCSEKETVYDLDCNIKYGINILQRNYDLYRSDTATYNMAIDVFCTPTTTEKTERNTKYKQYTGWDRATRAYNGFGCDSDIVAGYVERVNKVKDIIFAAESSGILAAGNSDISVAPPTGIVVFMNNNNELVVRWQKSADDSSGQNDVFKYNIYRRKTGENYQAVPIASVSAGVTEYQDIPEGLTDTNKFEFRYQVEAVDKNDNAAKSDEGYAVEI